MPPSTPTVSLELLRTLHRLLRQLAELRQRQRRGPLRAGALQVGLTQQQQQLAQTQTDFKKLRVATDQKQLQLKVCEEKIQDRRRKLNTASSNREYQALRDQIAADEMTNSVLTDEIIEALEKVDQSQKKIAEMAAALTSVQQKAEAASKQLIEEQPRIQADLKRVEAALHEAEAALPPTVLEIYRRIVRHRGEDALAMVENQCCGGCHQQVPVNVYAQIVLCRPIFCKTCGRLLYLPEGADRPQPAAEDG